MAYFLKPFLFGFIIIGLCIAESLPFSTGFDSADERNAWTQYRLADLDMHNWSFVEGDTSMSWNIWHDYPMDTGVDSVDDWLVSPPLEFPGESKISIYVKQMNYMGSIESVYFGIWLSQGEMNPELGDYTEIANLTSPEMETGWIEHTDIEIPSISGDGYIALRYRAHYYEWLMIWVDNILIESIGDITDKKAIPNNSTIVMYPNPFNSSVAITVNVGDACMRPATIDIYDLRGNVVGATRRVAQQKGDASHRPYIWTPDQSIASGIYLVRARTEDGNCATKRIVYLK